MAYDPAWMHSVLVLLASRADAGALPSLPLQSFDMEAQHEAAFRALQSGLNPGNIVVRFATHATITAGGVQAVTGGTGGLGRLTGRWLAQHGSRQVYLVSRSGKLARDTAEEWDALLMSGTPVLP